MLILGLTGGIATGKSTVSQIISQSPYNIPIIDADVLARRVVEPGTHAYKQIVAYFAPTTPDLLLDSSSLLTISLDDPAFSQGKTNRITKIDAPLNRAALGKRVFGDSEECQKNRTVLNKIVHPKVRLEMIKEILKYYISGHWMVVLDVPLLFEGGLDLICGTVVVVAVRDIEVQIKRLLDRDPHLSRSDAQARVKSQVDLSEKVKKCLNRGKDNGIVIYNDGDIFDLKNEIQYVIFQLRRAYPQWWTFLTLLFPPIAGWIIFWQFGRNWLLNKRWEQHESMRKLND